MSFREGERALVTGATGFLGSHLVRHLVRYGCQVGVLLRRGSNRIRIQDVIDKVDPLEGDLLQPEELYPLVRDFAPKYVFHLAAYGVNRPLESAVGSVNVNVQGTINLLEACCPLRVAAFLYTGTCYEYGDGGSPCTENQPVRPPNYYAASKAAGWLFACLYTRLSNLPVVTVRPFQAYGPYQGCRLLIPYVITSALQGVPLRLTPGDQIRDFVFVDDVIDGMIQAVMNEATIGQTVNLGSGQGVRVREMVERILDLLGWPVEANFGALEYRKGEVWDLRADIQRARELLNWTPKVPLDEGLQRTVEWYRCHLDLAKQLSNS